MEMIFLILDPERYNTGVPKTPEDWTLGEDQKAWFKKKLKCDATGNSLSNIMFSEDG